MDNSLTVIICTWNRAASLSETLHSLRRQRGLDRVQVEVIVVDNNSNDSTREMVESHQANWPFGDLVYLFEPRQGKQFALNLAINNAKHEILAFTDDDIVFSETWLISALGLFEDSAVELAGGRTLITWPAVGRPPWYHDEMQAVLGAVDLGPTRLDPAPDAYAPGGANLLARRQLFARVGKFSETHFRHMDFEFGMRCRALGVRVVYEPSLLVYAPVDEHCLSLRYFRRWSFKAGFGRSGSMDVAADGFPSVPAWVYRQAVEDWLSTWRCRTASPSADAFSRELRMWRCWGTIANAWYAWLLPSRHPAWVMAHSQKKDNLY